MNERPCNTLAIVCAAPTLKLLLIHRFNDKLRFKPEVLAEIRRSLYSPPLPQDTVHTKQLENLCIFNTNLRLV